jgi:catecholate siderophore receptor
MVARGALSEKPSFNVNENENDSRLLIRKVLLKSLAFDEPIHNNTNRQDMNKPITSRKHPVLRPAASAALAMLMLPLAAHAADGGMADAAEGGSPQRIHVHGDRERENEYKADQAGSPKYTQPLLDTPQTVIVIKKELFQQQGAVTLTEAMRNTPGVGTFFLGENGSTNTGDAIYMRGFDSSGSLFVDGIRDVGSVSRDVFNIEQIDVLKGPAGTDTGRGAPTGSINLNTKQPQLKNFGEASLTAGSAERLRGTADLNRVLDGRRGIAMRVNLLDQDNGNAARDQVKDKRWAVAPSIAFGLRGPTQLYLDYLHVRQDNRPDGGVPTIGLPGYTSPDPKRPYLTDAAPVDSKNFYGSVGDFDRVKADMFTAILDHEFSPHMRLRNTSRYGKTRQFYLLSAFMGNTANLLTPNLADPSGWALARTIRTIKDQQNTILANQTVLTSEFGTGSLRHTLVSGLDLSSEKQNNWSYAGTGALPAANLYRPDPGILASGVNLVRSGARTQGQVDTQSAYLLDTIKIGERWQFGAGARIDRFDVDYDAVTLSTLAANPALPVNTPIPAHIELSDHVVSGKVSALYKPTSNSSVYALWANSKQPPGSNLVLSGSANSASNPVFQPQVSTTTELGGKLDLLKQRLALTAALYRTEVKNEVEQDPVDLKYYQTGRKRVQGVEVGVTGELTRHWLLSAGYTWMDTSVESGKLVTALGENALSYTPKQAFTSWTTYTFPFGLQVGGGVRYQGRLLRGTDGAVGTPAYADDYWVTDATAGYTVNRWLDLRLNVYNLFDKRYIAAINKSGYRYTPGAPRWASVTANFHF